MGRKGKKPQYTPFNPEEYPALPINDPDKNRNNNDPPDKNRNNNTLDNNNNNNNPNNLSEADITAQCQPILNWLFTDRFLNMLRVRSQHVYSRAKDLIVYGGLLRFIIEHSLLRLSEQQDKLIEYLRSGGDIDLKTENIHDILGELIKKENYGPNERKKAVIKFNNCYNTRIKSYYHNNDDYIRSRSLSLHAKIDIVLQLESWDQKVDIDTDIDLVASNTHEKVLYDFDVNTLEYNINTRKLYRKTLVNEINNVTGEPITFEQIVQNIRARRYLMVGGLQYVKPYRFTKMIKRGYHIVKPQFHLLAMTLCDHHFSTHSADAILLLEYIFKDPERIPMVINKLKEGMIDAQYAKDQLGELQKTSRFDITQETPEYKRCRRYADKYYDYVKWIMFYILEGSKYIELGRIIDTLRLFKGIKVVLDMNHVRDLLVRFKDDINIFMLIKDALGFEIKKDIYFWFKFYGLEKISENIDKEVSNQDNLLFCRIIRYSFGIKPPVSDAYQYSKSYDIFMWFYNAIDPEDTYKIKWYKVMQVAMVNCDKRLVEFIKQFWGITIPKFYQHNLMTKPHTTMYQYTVRYWQKKSEHNTFSLFGLNTEMYYPDFIEYVCNSIKDDYDLFLDFVHETVENYPFVPHLIQLIMSVLRERGSLGMNMITIEWILDQHYRKAWDDQKELFIELNINNPTNKEKYDYNENEGTPDLKEEDQREIFFTIFDIICGTSHPLDSDSEGDQSRHKYNKFVCEYLCKRFGHRGMKTPEYVKSSAYRNEKIVKEKQEALQSFNSLK